MATVGAAVSAAFSVTLSRRELSFEHRVYVIQFSGTRLTYETILPKDRPAPLQMKLKF